MNNREKCIQIIETLSDSKLGYVLAYLQGLAVNQEYEDAYNAETLEAMEEVEDMKAHPEKYKSYTDVDQMMKELLT